MRSERRGRSRLQIDTDRLRHLREEGLSFRQIAQKCGVGKDTVRNTLKTLSKNSYDATFRKRPWAGKAPGREAGS